MSEAALPLKVSGNLGDDESVAGCKLARGDVGTDVFGIENRASVAPNDPKRRVGAVDMDDCT